MTDEFYIDQSGLSECIMASCSRRAVPNGIYCPVHAEKEKPKSGLIEPAVEARARAAGDAVAPDPPRAYAGPDPDTVAPMVKEGRVVDDDGTGRAEVRYDRRLEYLHEALSGEHGGIKRAAAEAMVRAVVEGLRTL